MASAATATDASASARAFIPVTFILIFPNRRRAATPDSDLEATSGICETHSQAREQAGRTRQPYRSDSTCLCKHTPRCSMACRPASATALVLVDKERDQLVGHCSA